MKKIDPTRFERICNSAENKNQNEGFTRYYTIRSHEYVGSGDKRNKIIIFGLYDSKKKKYAISKPYIDVNIIFDEMEEMLR